MLSSAPIATVSMDVKLNPCVVIKGLSPSREHDENRPRTVDKEIVAGIYKRIFRRAEQPDEGFAEQENRRGKQNPEKDEQRGARVKDGVCVLSFVFAEEDARQRRAAEAHEVGKRAYDERDGEHDAQPRQRLHADALDGTDVHAVYEIVQKIDELCDHGGDGKFYYQFSDAVSSEVERFFLSNGIICRHNFIIARKPPPVKENRGAFKGKFFICKAFWLDDGIFVFVTVAVENDRAKGIWRAFRGP